MKITNRWESFKTNYIEYQVMLSGGPPILDEGRIEFGQTYEVPDDKLGDGRAFALTVTGENSLNRFESNALTRLSNVTIVVTNPYQP